MSEGESISEYRQPRERETAIVTRAERTPAPMNQSSFVAGVGNEPTGRETRGAEQRRKVVANAEKHSNFSERVNCGGVPWRGEHIRKNATTNNAGRAMC
jgi:hypothetical protein